MNKDQARQLISDTFGKSYDKGRFSSLAKNLLNQVEDSPFTYRGNLIPDAYDSYIQTLERLGKYEDPAGNKLDVLVVHLKKGSSLERARTMQRNFVGWYLNGSRGGEQKDAALAAFVSPDGDDWRFSLVKMEYKLQQTPSGRTRAKEEFTPARRHSFLVGAHESSHTAQSRLVPLLEDDEHNPTLQQLEESFNIEKVTKEFFTKYRELYLQVKDALDGIVEKDAHVKADFDQKNVSTVDFAKKLLGQIVFLYFLQKKGWFGVKRGQEWGTGSKHFLRELFNKSHSDYTNFFDDIMEPLFYEALRNDRSYDDHYFSMFKCKIPFLNGGLFDPIGDYDWKDTDILLSNELFSNNRPTKEGDKGDGILDVFDRYNFTVKEDEPLEKEVAVDPEMLGKVFENLLEVKDRKSKGTYYTPREIVHYMCQESLINYLFTACNPPAGAPAKSYQKLGVPQTQAFGNEVLAKGAAGELMLEDPTGAAIPREDLEELIKHGEEYVENDRHVLEIGHETDRYKWLMPESVRQNAKLIDEKLASILVCDPAVGSGAFPVGMMNEIIRARNALTTYLGNIANRTPYDFKRHAIQNCLYGVDLDAGAVEIAKLRLWLSLIVDEEDIKRIKPLPNLDYKIVCGNSLLGVQRTLENDRFFKQLEELKPQYFDETNAKRKQALKKQIDELIGKITNGRKDFDFEVYFSEVFHAKKGFDVVIANPPYVSVKSISQQEKRFFSTMYKSGQGRLNLFTLFLEKGHKLLKPKGVLTFILPEGLYSNVEYRHTREYILNNAAILFVNLFSNKVFDAAVDTSIISISNRRDENGLFPVYRDLEHKVLNLNQSSLRKLPFFLFPVNLTTASKPIIDKLLNDKFDHIQNILEVQQGIIYSGQPKEQVFANRKINQFYKPVLDGRDIIKWKINWSAKSENKFIYYSDNLHRAREERLFLAKEKILLPRKSMGIYCGYDDEQFYALNTAYICLLKNRSYSLKFVLACLNSKLINFYYSCLFFGWQVTIPALDSIPIKIVSSSNQNSFVSVVDKILALTGAEDYLSNAAAQAQVKEYERQIDGLVYELYGLTEEEIKIIEN